MTRGLPDRAANLARDGAEIRRVRRALEDGLERMLEILDAIDSDPDLDPDGCDELDLQHEIRGGALVRAA